jgi:hypothetical protein
VPDINTLLTLYGDYLFDAGNADKPGTDSGRAILFTSLCKILSLKQNRVIAEEKFLITSYLCIQKGLACEGIVLDSILTHIELVLFSNQPGVRCLIPCLYEACRRVVKRYISSKPAISENIRLCCYRLMSAIGLHFQNDLISLKNSVKLESMNSLYSEKILSATSDLAPGQFLFRMVVDTLITAVNVEESLPNVRFLLNTCVSLVRSDEFLVSVLAKVLEESLYLDGWNIETLLTTVRCLEQLSSHKNYPLELVKRICFSLMTLAESLFSKNQLSQTYFLVIAIYEASFSWLSSMDKVDSDCVSSTLATLNKFLSSFDKPAERSKRLNAENVTPSAGSYRKSLTSRVFTSEGKEEELKAGTLSPNSQKSLEEMCAEYTNSMIQRLLSLLFDELTRSGSLAQIEDSDEFGTGIDFKYVAFSSSLIIGYSDKIIVLRNAAKKFAWKVNFICSDLLANISPPSTPFSDRENQLTSIDLVIKGEIPLFSRESVVDEVDLTENPLLLNDAGWHGSLQDHSVHCEEILQILDNARSNLESMLSEAPKKANQFSSQQNFPINAPFKAFTLLSHLSLLLPSTRSVLMPLPKSECFVSDLKRLDAMNFKLEFDIPIEYRDSSSPAPSNGFNTFFNGLRTNSQIYEEHSVKVNFSVNIPCPNAPISVIWSENGESVDNLPTLIPADSSSSFYLVISPILIGDSIKGHFYQVRILLSKCAPADSESFQKYSNVSLCS